MNTTYWEEQLDLTLSEFLSKRGTNWTVIQDEPFFPEDMDENVMGNVSEEFSLFAELESFKKTYLFCVMDQGGICPPLFPSDFSEEQFRKLVDSINWMLVVGMAFSRFEYSEEKKVRDAWEFSANLTKELCNNKGSLELARVKLRALKGERPDWYIQLMSEGLDVCDNILGGTMTKEEGAQKFEDLFPKSVEDLPK